MKVELENILDIGTTLYSLDENFKIKRKVVVNIQSVFEQNVSHSPEIHTTYKVSNTMSGCLATDVRDLQLQLLIRKHINLLGYGSIYNNFLLYFTPHCLHIIRKVLQ